MNPDLLWTRISIEFLNLERHLADGRGPPSYGILCRQLRTELDDNRQNH
jgi:hypothetical protein